MPRDQCSVSSCNTSEFFQAIHSFQEARINVFTAQSERVSCLVVSNSLPPQDCSPPGSSLHGILQAGRLERLAISFSTESSRPGIKPGSPTCQAHSLLPEPPGKSSHTPAWGWTWAREGRGRELVWLLYVWEDTCPCRFQGREKGFFFFFLMNPVMLKKCASQTYCVNSWEGEGKVTHLPRCQVLPETPGVYCGGVPTPTLKTNRLNSCAWSLSLCRAARLLWPVADARSLRREC